MKPLGCRKTQSRVVGAYEDNKLGKARERETVRKEVEVEAALTPSHVYHNGHEWYVATSADEAMDLCLRATGSKPGDKSYEYALMDAEGDGWEQVPDAEELGLWVDDPPTQHEKWTCAEWATKNGAGFLGTTEY